MGEIFLARQRGVAGFDRLAILKSLLPDLAEDEASLAAFLDEARLAAHLNHPNVVAVYEVDKWEGVYFLAMEYIAGIDLSRLLKMLIQQNLRPPPGLLAAVFRDACRGLGFAHTAVDATGSPLNLVHRDATPHNIMLRRDGTAKVVDFGVAKAANRAVKTSTGVLKGKLQYMPPEQVRGEEVTARSDQWALGASLWEMLVGRRLINATEPVDVFRTILTGRFPPASTVTTDVPPELDIIVTRMIAPDPAVRFASCIDAADALDEIVRRSGIRTSHIADFVGRVAGNTIDAVTRDLTPQPVSIIGHNRNVVPLGSGPSASGLSATDVVAQRGDSGVGPASGVACPSCGTRAPPGSRFCNSCGSALAPASAPAGAPGAEPVATVVVSGIAPSSSPTSNPPLTPQSGSRLPAGQLPSMPPLTPSPSGARVPAGQLPSMPPLTPQSGPRVPAASLPSLTPRTPAAPTLSMPPRWPAAPAPTTPPRSPATTVVSSPPHAPQAGTRTPLSSPTSQPPLTPRSGTSAPPSSTAVATVAVQANVTPHAGSRPVASPVSFAPAGTSVPRLASLPSTMGVGGLVDVGALGLAAAEGLMRSMALERRRVCVVRASISGALAPDEHPELAQQRAHAMLTHIEKLVVDEGGAIEALDVDNLLFVFGLERFGEDDAVVAVRAAIAVDNAVREFAAAWGLQLGLRAGVDVGPAVVNDGPQGRRLSGPVKDRATRIERRVGSPRVLVSIDVQRLVRHAWETATPFPLKDDTTTIEVAQVVRPATVVARDAFFVGRERELTAAARALSQRPSRCFFVGTSGSGRTALLDEVVRRAAAAGTPTVRVTARRSTVPWALARALLVGDVDIDAARTRLEQIGVSPASVHRLVRLFFGDELTRRGAATPDDSAQIDEIAVAEALAAVTRGGAIIVDDWGRADAGSRAVLASLAARGADVSLIAALLPDDNAPEGVERVPLAPLTDDDLRVLCAHTVGVEALPSTALSYVCAHAGGNPSLATLIVDGLVDARVLTVHAGRATAAANIASVAAPASLLRAWEARFDRLTDETRTLLRAAAVLGYEFSLDVAAAMIGVDGQLRGPALLTPAQQAGLVEHLLPGLYAFAHAGLRDAVRGRLLAAELTQLHRRALDLLAQRTADDDVGGLQALAHHAEAAGDDPRFALYGWKAARALVEHGGRKDGVAWYARVLDVAERVARQTAAVADVATLVQLVSDATMATLPVDAPAAAEFWTKHAEALSAAAPAEARAWALRARGLALVAAGKPQKGIEAIDLALESLPDDDEDTRALFLSDLGGALEAAGDVQGAVSQIVEAFRRMQGRQSRHVEFGFEALNRLGRLYLRSKLTAKAREAFVIARQQAETNADDAALSRCLTNLGTCAALDGDVAGALTLFGDAVDVAVNIGDLTQASRARLNLGRLLLQSDPARAREVLSLALGDAERVGWKEGIALGRSALAAVRV